MKSIIFLLALLNSGSALAQAYKCVNSAGATIYTDQACTNMQASEVKNDAAIRKITSIQGDQDLRQSCWKLMRRYDACNVSMDSTLMRHFRENCKAPIAQYEKDKRSRENSRYNSYRREENRESENYYAKSKRELECDVLQKQSWDFLKKNFSEQIPAQDAVQINYKLHNAPSDGRERVVLTPRK